MENQDYDYHNDFNNYSKSFLTKFAKSPMQAYNYMHSEHVDSSAMKFGRAYHAIMDGSFDRYFCTDAEICEDIGGAKPRATNVYKEWIATQTKEIISTSDLDQINKMKKVLEANDLVKKINAFDMVQEQPFKAEIDGLKVKCKPDGLQLNRGKLGENLVIDWKTCDDISRIEWDIEKFGYDVQAALYTEIISHLHNGQSNMLFVFQEKKAPFEVMPVLVRWGGDVWKNGAEKWRRYAKQADECFASDCWPMASDLLIEKCIIL